MVAVLRKADWICIVWICISEIYLICIMEWTSDFQNCISSHILPNFTHIIALSQVMITIPTEKNEFLQVNIQQWLRGKASEGSWNLSVCFCFFLFIPHSTPSLSSTFMKHYICPVPMHQHHFFLGPTGLTTSWCPSVRFQKYLLPANTLCGLLLVTESHDNFSKWYYEEEVNVLFSYPVSF